MFHIPAEEIFRRNHLTADSTLHVGQILHIPNPYVAQVRELQTQIEALHARVEDQERKLQDADTREGAYNARVVELNGIKRAWSTTSRPYPGGAGRPLWRSPWRR